MFLRRSSDISLLLYILYIMCVSVSMPKSYMLSAFLITIPSVTFLLFKLVIADFTLDFLDLQYFCNTFFIVEVFSDLFVSCLMSFSFSDINVTSLQFLYTIDEHVLLMLSYISITSAIAFISIFACLICDLSSLQFDLLSHL